MFPEIDYDKIDNPRGMDITIVTTATDDAAGKALLDAFGFPFRTAEDAATPPRQERRRVRPDPRRQEEVRLEMAKKALINKAAGDAQVQGARLHALPSLRAGPFRVPQVRPVPRVPARAGPRRRDPRPDEVELVRRSTAMMTDPIADMLTRVRNANTAMHDQVKMPSSKQKVALAEVLQKEGYIVGYEVAPSPKGVGEVLTITMKYSPDRERTISGIKRVSTPGLRVYRNATSVLASSAASVSPSCPPPRGPDDRPRSAQAQGRRRSPLLRLVIGEELMSRIGQSTHRDPVRGRRDDRRRDGHRQGPQGRRSPRTVPGDDHASSRSTAQLLVARPDDERDNRALHGLTRSLVNNMVVGVTDGFRKQLEIVGVGYRAEAQGHDAHPPGPRLQPPGRSSRRPHGHHRSRCRCRRRSS